MVTLQCRLSRHLVDRRPEALMIIGGNELDAIEASVAAAWCCRRHYDRVFRRLPASCQDCNSEPSIRLRCISWRGS
jgi:hypothetical protein